MSEHETEHRPSECARTLDRADLVTENENLRRRLESQPVIEQAKGILMVCHGVSADDAFEMLSRWSQDTNTKVHQIARSIVSDPPRVQILGATTFPRGPAPTE